MQAWRVEAGWSVTGGGSLAGRADCDSGRAGGSGSNSFTNSGTTSNLALPTSITHKHKIIVDTNQVIQESMETNQQDSEVSGQTSSHINQLTRPY